MHPSLMKRAERMASLQPCNQIRNKILIQIAGGEKKKIPQKKSLKNKKKKRESLKGLTTHIEGDLESCGNLTPTESGCHLGWLIAVTG